MGQIREEFILADEFSATFSRFLQMGQGAADQLTVLDRSNQGFAQSSANAARELDSMRSALAAQQTLHAAQSQRLEAQGRKVQELSEKYRALAAERGESAASTLRAAEALARAQISEQALLQQSMRTAEAISRQNTAIQEFSRNMETARQAARPVEIPVVWRSDDSQAIAGTGVQRLEQEARETEAVLERLIQAQDTITRRASEAEILPPEAAYEVQMLENRLVGLRAAITQIGENPVDMGIDQANNQLENTRERLTAALRLQRELGDAMEGTDLSEINEAYLSLSRTLSGMERDLRDSLSRPVEIPVTWERDGLEVFTSGGLERYREEVRSVNDMLTHLGALQESIGRNARGVSVLPESAIEDLNAMGTRIEAIRERLSGLGEVPVGAETDRMNQELEQLRGQLSQALRDQEALGAAVSGMDVESANAAYLRLSQTIGGTERRIRDNISETGRLERAVGDVNETCLEMTGIFGGTRRRIEDNTDAQRQFNRELEGGGEHAGKLFEVIKRVVAAYATIRTVKGAMDLSDQLTSTSARLGMVIEQVGSVSGELGTVKDFQDMIFQSAERSRGAYQDTANAVAKLGLMAGGAFSGAEEIVAFMEQINKQFTIAGTNASGIQAAMLQLTQAMGSGVLRGEEYNSILEQAPNIVQNIGKYIEGNETVLRSVASAIGMETEDLAGDVQKHLKKIAGEGLISAEMVKAAMFAAAAETNEKFESMPKTFSQIWKSFKNYALKAFEPTLGRMSEIANSDAFQRFVNGSINVLSILGGAAANAFDGMISAAAWVADNLNIIIPVLAAIGIAYGILHGQALLAGAANVASAMASAVAWGVANWPLLLLTAAITGAFISAQGFGLGMRDIGQMVGAAFGLIYSVGYNVFANLWNLIASFAEFFANVWDDPLGATVRLFAGVFDSILGIIETVAGAIDSLLGSDMAGAVSGFRDKVSDWVQDTYGESAIEIERMANLDVSDTMKGWGDAGADLGAKLDNIDFSLDSLAEGFGGGFDLPEMSGLVPKDIGKVGSVGNVKNVEGEIRLADEDLKLYQDLAERRYLNQIELKTLAPNISVTLPPGSAASSNPEAVADYIKKMLIEQMGSHTAISHG